MSGDLAKAEARFSEARHLATEAGDDVILARALTGGGYLEFRRSRLAQAQAMWEEALERAERAGDERVAAGVLRSLAIAAGSSGRQDRAGELLDRAIGSGSTNGRRSATPVAARLGRRDAALARGLSGGGRRLMETPSHWPRPSAICRPVPCCWPSWDGWPCYGATWFPLHASRSKQPSWQRISGTAGCGHTPFG